MSVEADSGKTGLKTLMTELHDPAAPPPGTMEAEQLALLPLDAPRMEPFAPPLRGPGRPAGAKNKNTEQWRDYLLSKHSSPLEGLFQTFTRPVEEIAAILSCSKLEAYKLQLMAMKEAAPYVHQKMPLAIDGGERGLINLFLNTAPASAAAVGSLAESAIIEILNEPQQNQILSASDIENSNVSTSNVLGQAVEDEGETTDATD